MKTMPEWLYEAACRGVDPDLFFPDGESRVARKRTSVAKAVCGRCPVKAQCLQWALENDERLGIWGGFTAKERRRLRRGGTPGEMQQKVHGGD